ncbi:glycosyltransferase family 4 protein [Arundinibacter roseus]|uniref:Glycosyltransferase family 1 protein n=1 Tax=Arundinibacter roseus TaxID=2070510 RepID=A0A4R4K7I4_9BACT|nr:glycosyltransferase family 4 protein [Arundinibacter roseus]TDB63470.1 glycosyltransferase family 1 protein [Arundinibacter roseus]
MAEFTATPMKAKPRKVLVILAHTGSGGDTQSIFNLLSVLSLEGFDFHFLSYQRGVTHTNFQRFGKIYTFPLDEKPLVRRIMRRFFLSTFEWLKNRYGRYLIKKLNPDFVYLNTVNENEFSSAAVQSGRRFVVHIHEMGFVVTQRMRPAWIETLVNKAELVISPAQAVSEFYQDVYGLQKDKIRLIYETVDAVRLEDHNPGTSFRAAHNIPENAILVGAAGSVIYRKGVDLLVNACAEIQQLRPEQPCLFLWLGGYPDELQRQPFFRSIQKSIARKNLSEHFRFLPYTPQVSDFYGHLDIFVLPSRMEAFPLVVLEALLKEIPVVAMDVAGVREVIDQQTGYLVKDQSSEGLAEGIRYFLESQDRRKTAGKQGRARVLEQFEARVQAPKWLHLLQNL